jgi:hypothetical protein
MKLFRTRQNITRWFVLISRDTKLQSSEKFLADLSFFFKRIRNLRKLHLNTENAILTDDSQEMLPFYSALLAYK